MNPNSLRGIDEPNAALRILLEISKEGQGVNVTRLYEVMGALDVGRTAVDSSRKSLISVGLVEEVKMKGEKGKLLKILFTTPSGYDVAMKIREIQEIMDKLPKTSSDKRSESKIM
jgi:predicted transcriptional regulator